MIKRLFGWTCSTLFLGVWSAAAAAAEAPAAGEALAEALRLEAQHAYRVEITATENPDPVVFTDISPYTTDETPVRLPDDQSLD